jgi:hypothetical protein
VINSREGQLLWKLTGFYGHLGCNKREESWAILRFLSSLQPAPWLCVGDFNEIVEQVEKEGSLLRRDSQMNHFHEAFEFCQLGDLGFTGPRFTWCNQRMDHSFTKERLDRAVASSEWCAAFPKVSVLVLPTRASDHNPLSVSFSESISEGIPHRRGFKYEAWWEKDAECTNVIKSSWGTVWSEEGTVAGIQTRLFACQRALVGWSNRKYGRMEDLIKEKSAKLLSLQNSSSPAVAGQIKHLQQEIEGLLEKERCFGSKERNNTGFVMEIVKLVIFTLGRSTEGRLTISGLFAMSRGGFGGKKGTSAGFSWSTLVEFSLPKALPVWKLVLARLLPRSLMR